MNKHLGKLELQIMKTIWNKGKASVWDVWGHFYPEKKLEEKELGKIQQIIDKYRKRGVI